MATPTTIKLPSSLRDRINEEARHRGTTAAGLIELLLDRYQRALRMDAFGRAFADADRTYWDEFDEWDLAAGDVDGTR